MITIDNVSSLSKFLQNYQAQIPALADYQSRLVTILKRSSHRPKESPRPEESPQLEESYQQIKGLLELYDQIYPLIEPLLWHTDNFDEILAMYQSLFQEQEAFISRLTHD